MLASPSWVLIMGVPGSSLPVSPVTPWTRGIMPVWMLPCDGGDDGDAAWLCRNTTPRLRPSSVMWGEATRVSP